MAERIYSGLSVLSGLLTASDGSRAALLFQWWLADTMLSVHAARGVNVQVRELQRLWRSRRLMRGWTLWVSSMLHAGSVQLQVGCTAAGLDQLADWCSFQVASAQIEAYHHRVVLSSVQCGWRILSGLLSDATIRQGARMLWAWHAGHMSMGACRSYFGGVGHALACELALVEGRCCTSLQIHQCYFFALFCKNRMYTCDNGLLQAQSGGLCHVLPRKLLSHRLGSPVASISLLGPGVCGGSTLKSTSMQRHEKNMS